MCTLGWNKASLSVDASEENNGYSSSEDPMNSDTEDEAGKKLVSLSPGFIMILRLEFFNASLCCLLFRLQGSTR